MSTLTNVLQKEFDRLEVQKINCEQKLRNLPRGYISKKNIRGNISYYLQYRENGKIVSKYIPRDHLVKIEGQITERKELEHTLKIVKCEQKRLEKVMIFD